MANATTNAKAILSFCVTPQNEDLTSADAEALTWVPVGMVGSFGEHGYDTNMISYPTLDQDLTVKAKGTTDGGNVTIEVAENNSDPGQIALNTAAHPSDANNYALKIAYANGDIRYVRGPIGGPRYSGGGSEDFRTATYTLGANQVLSVPATP